MLTLIGSRALEFQHANLLGRKPFDYDFIGSYDDIQLFLSKINFYAGFNQVYPIDDGKKLVAKNGKSILEFEIAWEGSSAEDYIKMNRSCMIRKVFGEEVKIASGADVLAFKMTHRYLKNSPHFNKTRNDINKLRDKYMVPLVLTEWVKKREKETYVYSHPKLDVKKNDFFKKDDGIDYIYDHDTIHLAVKHLEKPAYEYFKKPNSEVMCDRGMFLQSDENTRLHSVLEEAYVLALERSQIPFEGKWTPRKSFEVALMKVCTSITSGWWREYAWEHYDAVLTMYKDDYVDRFRQALVNGVVKNISTESYNMKVEYNV